MIVYEYRCRGCDEPLTYPGVGRPRVYCDSCRPDWFPAVKEVPSAVSMAFPGFPEAPTTRTVPVKAHERRVSGPPSVPLARTGDGVTSRVAISPEHGDKAEAAILAVFAHDALTDDELCARLPDWYPPTIKSARSRLARAGYLHRAGEGVSKRGRRMTRWIYAAMEETG